MLLFFLLPVVVGQAELLGSLDGAHPKDQGGGHEREPANDDTTCVMNAANDQCSSTIPDEVEGVVSAHVEDVRAQQRADEAGDGLDAVVAGKPMMF